MTLNLQRRKALETMLQEEFQAEGYRTVNDEGVLYALVMSLTGEGFTEFAKINLSRIAEQIDARLP